MNTLLDLVIVDDEAFMRENLRDLFPWEEMGYQIVADFSNGREALDFLHRTPVHVVLTDIQMPGMNGIELLQRLRRDKLPCQVIFLSAYSDFEYARQGIQYGAFDYLTKPVRYQELAELFSRVYALLAESPQKFPEFSSEERILASASDYIRQNNSNVSLEACAAWIGYESTCLSALLRQRFQMNFVEFVNREKMLWAGELLHDIRLNISEVADTIGYANAKNFSRAFHNYYHMTPMQYRKQKKF